MTSSWSETILATILSNYKLEDIFNADEFGLFYLFLPDKIYHLKGEKCSGEKKAESGLLGWQQQVWQEKKCPCLWSGNLKISAVLRMSSIYPMSANHERIVGWIVRSLKSGSVNSTESFVQMIENCSYHWQLSSPSINLRLDQRSNRIFVPQIRRPFFNRWTKVSYTSLTLFRMDFFGDAHFFCKWSYPTMVKLGTVIPYQRKIQKIYKSRDTFLDSYRQHFFTRNQQILPHQEVHI